MSRDASTPRPVGAHSEYVTRLGSSPNENRPRKAEPSLPSGAGNEIRTHDFNLGNIRLALNTIREIQQHQPHSVPWRCVPSRGVPWKVEGSVEDLGRRQALRNPSVDFIEDDQVDLRTSTTQGGARRGQSKAEVHGVKGNVMQSTAGSIGSTLMASTEATPGLHA